MPPFKLLIVSILWCLSTKAQLTTGNITGTVKMQKKPVLGASIILYDISRGNQQQTISNFMGNYHFENLLPSTQYKIQFQAEYADTLIIDFIEVKLGSTTKIDASLNPSINILHPITVTASAIKEGIENNKHFHIGSTKIESLAISGRNYFNLLKYIPTANTGNGGSVSFSGQNNRYNSLYIDGALQNDVFGLSQTGTYGGSTESAPISLEMIDQLQAQLSPYDASLGGYTGAAINLITKSGKNKPYSSIYRYSGIQKGIYNNTGIVLSGPIKENHFFYFFNADYTREEIAQEFDIKNYLGNTKNENQFRNFITSIQSNFGYDPGSLNQSQQKASSKIALRLDYQIAQKHRINLSVRKHFSHKLMTGRSSAELLFFSNNGKLFESSFFSGSLEINSKINQQIENQFSINYSKSTDEIVFLGKAFPSVRILDGEGIIFLGSNEDAQESNTNQNNWNIRNKMNYHKGKKIANLGIELEWNKINNQFLPNKFGSYFYYSIADFLNTKTPGSYEINYPQKSIPTIVHNIKMALFLNSHLSISKKIVLHAGIRMSFQQLKGNPLKDSSTNSIVLPTIASYYPTHPFSYGNNPIINPDFSPRLSCLFQFPTKMVSIEIGTGLFGGRMPLAWMSGMYYNNGLNYTYFEASKQDLKKIKFEPSILKQWQPILFNKIGNKGVLNLLPETISMPSVWRSSIEISKWFKQNWLIQIDAMYYFNQTEIAFSNINLLPQYDTLQGPDNRPIYTAPNKARIPIASDSIIPYESIILMENNSKQHGFGYRYGLKIKKDLANTRISLQYSFGESYSVFDGNYSVLVNQWRLNEHKYGRNDLRLSRADFSPGHLIQFWVKRDWVFGKKMHKISVSFSYIGKSGSGFSYVYGGKNMNTDDPQTTGYDLLYIPTITELKEQRFIPLVTNNTYYTADQQKEALEWFIEHSEYLKKNRGQYAERNGSRAPFNQQIDIKISTYEQFKINNRKYGLSISMEILNLTNLINASWGQTRYLPSNHIKLINFEGFLTPNQKIPQFSFDPTMVQIQKNGFFKNSTVKFGQEWQIQLGLRISFY